MDPIFTIAEAAKLIAEKKLSPVELTEDCIARMKAKDDTLHAFILPTEERALPMRAQPRCG
jgi:aspartyl-tRNA(Asn)/glutamyl-tRNA(Gln) amidotransferase subunit A